MSAARRNPALHARVTEVIESAIAAAGEMVPAGTSEAAEAVLDLLLDPSGRAVSAGNVEAAARGAVVEPTTDERGMDEHPAWGLLGVSHVSTGPRGAVLFDSDVLHNNYVTLTLRGATRQRQLNHDRVYAANRAPIVEVAMSEAQWAAMVSSSGQGDGVPCTIRYRSPSGAVPGMPYAPRLALSIDEARGAADRAVGGIAEAFAAYNEHRTAANRRTLEAAIRNAGPNVEYAAQTLVEHAESVVTKARADIESAVARAAEQRGLDPADFGDQLAIDAGPATDDDGSGA